MLRINPSNNCEDEKFAGKIPLILSDMKQVDLHINLPLCCSLLNETMGLVTNHHSTI